MVFGETREDQVRKITNDTYTTLTNLGIDANQYEDVLERAAEDYLDRHTHLSEEGIEGFKAK